MLFMGARAGNGELGGGKGLGWKCARCPNSKTIEHIGMKLGGLAEKSKLINFIDICCHNYVTMMSQLQKFWHINELAWKSVFHGDLYESPYLAKATSIMDSQKDRKVAY